MNSLVWCACLLLSAGLTRGALDADADRLANLQSDLVRQTFDVIEEAIETQHQMLNQRIDALEARVEELEQVLIEGAPANPPGECRCARNLWCSPRAKQAAQTA